VIRDGAYAELPLPPGAQGAAHAINKRGDIVGQAFFESGDTRVVLWKAGGSDVTTLPAPAQWPGAHAIADDGTIFGSLGDGHTPYAWAPDGTGRVLPGPPGSNRGKAMGTAGDYVFGHAGTPAPTGDPGASKEDRARDGGGEPRWVRWQLSTGTVVEVTGGLSAYAVDATGAVVGSVRKGAAPNVTTGPARWRDGKVAELPGPDGAPATGGVTSVSHDGTRLAGWTGDPNAPVPTVWRC
jgi:uncharacterized membrane protein